MSMRRKSILTLIITVLAPTAGSSQSLDGLPVYQGNNDQFGEIRIWGNETMLQMLTAWELGIHEYQRGLRFADVLPSGAAAIGALYTGVADLGLMGHHSWPMETLAFHEVYGYDPLEITVATGAYDVPAKMPANVIYVNKKNPLAKLTVQQLDGILGSQRTGGWQGTHWSTESARGADRNIRTWGQLGLSGEWADKAIHPYGYDLSANSFCLSMQRMAFQGGDMWNPNLHEFALNEVGMLFKPGPRPPQGCEVIIDSLSKDPYGIAYTAPQCARKSNEVKPLALAADARGPFVEPTKENMANRTYPLVESIYVYINRPPGQPVEPKLKAFLTYILSRQGQEGVLRDGGYLPLTPEVAHEQLKKLE
jgi:phosphate transport system substrate-binding protein